MPDMGPGGGGRRSTKQSKYNQKPSSGGRQRAPIPSKAVIQYPKLKMRPAPPAEPSPSEPPVSTTVMRGKDTLIISLCKKPDADKPDKCGVQPDQIKTSKNPFQTVVVLEENEALDMEVEMAEYKSAILHTPLNCFSPPKWTLLEEEPPAPEAITQPSTVVAAHAGELAVETAGEQKSKGKDHKSGSVKGTSPPAKSGGKSSVDGKDKTSTPASTKTSDRKGGAIKSNISPTEKKSPGAVWRKEDDVSKSLLNKYLYGETGSRDYTTLGPDYKLKLREEAKWPPMNPTITAENRGTYEALGQELKGARRLIDMPIRKREKRLWKLPEPPHSSRWAASHPHEAAVEKEAVVETTEQIRETHVEEEAAGKEKENEAETHTAGNDATPEGVETTEGGNPVGDAE